jgi:hypothetical protein
MRGGTTGSKQIDLFTDKASENFSMRLAIDLLQIAEAVHGQTVRVLHALLGQPFDVAREIATHAPVEFVPGHPAINPEGADHGFCDLWG